MKILSFTHPSDKEVIAYCRVETGKKLGGWSWVRFIYKDALNWFAAVSDAKIGVVLYTYATMPSEHNSKG